MNNYNFLGIKGNDNFIIINNLTKEITLMKEKLKIYQSQLIILTKKYQKCLNLNQILKEKYNEFSKKILNNNQEDEELYDIMDSLRKQVKKLSNKLTLSEEKQKKIKQENQILFEENKKLKKEILKLKQGNNLLNSKVHHVKNSESLELKQNNKYMNLYKKSHSRNYSDNINKTKQNIESTNTYYENSLKTIVNNFKKIKINFKSINNENYNIETEDKTFSPKSNITDDKKDINKTINSHQSKEIIFDNEIKENNKIVQQNNNISLNNSNRLTKTEENFNQKSSLILYSKKHIPNINISLRKENNLKNNITNLSITDISFDDSINKKTIVEKKVPLNSLRKNLIKDNNSMRSVLNINYSQEKYLTIQTQNKPINSDNNYSNLNEDDFGIYRIDTKTNKIIFFNINTHKFELEQFANYNNYSFLQKSSNQNFITYTNKSGFYILTENEFKQDNNFFYLNPSKHFLEKLPNPQSYHKKSLLISYLSDDENNDNKNNNNIICFSGSNTTSVEVFNELKKKWSFLPYLENTYSDCSILIIDQFKLYCFFGYDYINECYNKNIIWIDLKNPNKWNIINVNLEIKNQFSFIPKYYQTQNQNTFLILGGTFSNNIPNSDMIQIIINNEKSEVYSNYNEGNFNNEPFIFNETFINYYDQKNNIEYKCGFDKKGNVHFIDISNIKHRIFDYKKEKVIYK